ncbi:protein gp37 [Variovorax boronicumulans]|uniref:phage Gp37/Gp68 family protein n=1 Tax=Variovorax boronicumulans TaxID=436515 RepID=UPI002781638B|nr:phage Gp37/Gp68 family protein [Variovorax boronicumulans]MDP9992026.1 protein gp37 [Variovorax boronicumulans]MDQ0001921.1 protein gp37 [Variovorax boronicumulans]
MAADSKIEWCDHTFNPWIGCTKVSIAASGGGGCDHCYAEMSTPVRVLRGKGEETWGAGAQRVRTSAANWTLPKRWNAQAESFRAQHGRRQRVFCASLADWLDNAVDIEWLVDLLALVRLTPDIDWLMLSKRIGIWRSRLEAAAAALRDRLERASETAVALLRWIERWLAGDAPVNVWIGATVVNQAEADRDVPKLLAVAAVRRFLSMEPLLGPVDLHLPWFSEPGTQYKPLLHWVIAGGESGAKARPMHPDWARSLREQCASAGVPFLFKQWGEWIEPDINGMPVRLTAREGDPEFFDAAAKVDGFLCVDGRFEEHVDDLKDDVRYLGMERIGKKAAGRLLDGREWNEVPHGAA